MSVCCVLCVCELCVCELCVCLCVVCVSVCCVSVGGCEIIFLFFFFLVTGDYTGTPGVVMNEASSPPQIIYGSIIYKFASLDSSDYLVHLQDGVQTVQ